jgi:hypothetical protein
MADALLDMVGINVLLVSFITGAGFAVGAWHAHNMSPLCFQRM